MRFRDVDDLVDEAVIIVSSETIWPANPAATIVCMLQSKMLRRSFLLGAPTAPIFGSDCGWLCLPQISRHPSDRPFIRETRARSSIL